MKSGDMVIWMVGVIDYSSRMCCRPRGGSTVSKDLEMLTFAEGLVPIIRNRSEVGSGSYDGASRIAKSSLRLTGSAVHPGVTPCLSVLLLYFTITLLHGLELSIVSVTSSMQKQTTCLISAALPLR